MMYIQQQQQPEYIYMHLKAHDVKNLLKYQPKFRVWRPTIWRRVWTL